MAGVPVSARNPWREAVMHLRGILSDFLLVLAFKAADPIDTRQRTAIYAAIREGADWARAEEKRRGLR